MIIQLQVWNPLTDWGQTPFITSKEVDTEREAYAWAFVLAYIVGSPVRWSNQSKPATDVVQYTPDLIRFVRALIVCFPLFKSYTTNERI